MPRARRIVVTCLAAVSVALVHADDEGLTLTPGREVTFETSEGTWLSLDVSPDGAEIAFELLGDIYRLPIDGGRAEPVTSGMAFDSQPRFSPDGEHIAFISDRDGQEDVWIMGRDGSDAKRLSEGGKMVELASPSFAPDGSHVIVSRTTWGLGTFELWAYHTDGGKGVQITKAKATPDTPRSQRSNALGAVYSPDGRYLYYAGKLGGFGYNVMLPQWQIVRRDLRSGDEDMLTQAQGSGMRPLLSPDGRWLVYGTRHDQHTGLRRRNLETGVDEWLIYPVEHDDQESRFTRDLLPGYAFTPDGSALIYAVNGTIHRYEFADGSSHEIPFTAKVEQSLGPRLYFPYRLGLGPVKARMLMGPELSPDGLKLAFSAFLELYVRDLTSGDSRVVSPDGVSAFHPTWSPDGRQLAYVSWSSEGGHVWRTRADGRGRPRQVSTTPGFYSDPVWSPDGKRIVALRASSYDRLYREADFGAPIGSDVVWFPADGGAANLVVPSRGFQGPHFGPESDRIYLSGNTGLISLRYDGTDRRAHLAVKGPGVYMAEEEVPAADIRISPDGRRALVLQANQLYLVEVLNPNLTGLEVSLANPSLPVARLTDVGADFFGWAEQGTEIYWTVGHQLYRRPVESVVFRDDEEANGDGTEGDQNGTAAEDEPTTEAAQDAAIAEMDEAVQSDSVDVYRPRHRPEGTLVLRGGTVMSMAEGASSMGDAVVVITNDRIVAVGEEGTVEIPDGAHEVDVSGRFLLPGFIDTHAHFRPLRRILDPSNWAFLANLAYGVTTGIDVQPSTTDILAYEDLIGAGLMIGPRALSTGPGIFSNNEFRSVDHAESVLRRYKEHYGVRNLKSYLAGDRKQRQFIVQAAARLRVMPTTEGGLDMKLDLTHVIDGFSGNEHNFPLLDLYRDTVELVARSEIAYTPTLLVSYGGPWAESYYYTRESPHHDAKLRRFIPADTLASRTLRGPWFLEEEYVFPAIARQAAKIIRAGGHVGVGAHGQLQGLGYHWEMWSLAAGGLTPLEVLTAATREGAEMIGVAEDIGTLAPGKLADLVVLRRDPLDDIRNTADIEYVVKNGELYEGDTLDELWPEQVPLPKQWWWKEAPRLP